VLRAALTVTSVLIPLQIFVGDAHGLNTLEHQPQKIAAMEALWHTQRGAPLVLFGWPDETAGVNRFAIEIPHGAALILTHHSDGELRGLSEFADAHPPVAPLFFSFRIMVGMGLTMLAISWYSLWRFARARWQIERVSRGLLRVIRIMTFSGWVATLAGWYVTEIGRQPFIIFGLVRTSEVASTTAASHIALTLAGYLVLYVALISAYVAVLAYMGEKPLEMRADGSAVQPGHA
jgi:cytochrome d ubiquinol oxidase subunit I